MDKDIAWHRFTGTMITFVNENAYKDDDLKPYIEEISKHTGLNDDDWPFVVMNSKTVKSLPDYLIPIAKKHLPTFFEMFPEYKDMNELFDT